MIELIYGEEPYLIEQHVIKVKKGLNNMNISVYDELGLEVFAHARQYPFFSERQVIIVRLDKLGSSQEQVDALNDYLKEPSDFTDLLIIAREVDKRVKTFMALKKAGFLKEFSKISPDMLQKFILQYIGKEKCRITESTYRYFVQRSGYLDNPDINLYVIRTYLKQLCMDADGREITVEAVDSFVEKSMMQNTFALTGTILACDGAGLFDMAVQFVEEGENPIGMLSLLLRAFRLAYKSSLFQEMPEKEMTALLGITSYQFKDVKRAMQYSSGSVSVALDILQKGVNDIKEGRASGEIVFYKSLSEVLETLVAQKRV